MSKQDLPLNLTHIEEYRKQKAEYEPRITVDTGCHSECWCVRLEGDTPSQTGIRRHVAEIYIDRNSFFLNWRVRRAKQQLLRQWKFICEIEKAK